VTAQHFVDTSAWYPLADREHPDHDVMSRVLDERVRSGARVVTTNLVVAETHALLLRRLGRAAALRFAREIRREPKVVETSTPEIETRAIEDWLARFKDQDFSLTDAVSFAVMSERGIRDALALDHHFTVAGFSMFPPASSA
jgi:predicted nucleic acid-binding protein